MPQAQTLCQACVKLHGINVLSTVVEGADAKSLRDVADQVRSKA